MLILRLALALVFIAASFGKLLDLAGSRRAVAEFGVPARAAAAAGTVLPFGELAIAAALILTPSGRWGGIAALTILLAFSSAIARVMRRGEAPDCHCFGQLHSEPAGAPSLVRNGLLMAAAAVVVIEAPGRSFASLSGEDVALTVMSVGFAALAGAAASLWLENRELRKRPAQRRRRPLQGLPVGTPAPDLALRDLRGIPVQLHSLIAGGTPTVLVHVSPQCGPCRALAPNLTRWTTTLSGALKLITLSSGEFDRSVEFANELELTDLLIAEESAFGDAYRARATPSAVMIDETGAVAARAVAGQMAIESLIRMALKKASGDAVLDPLQIVEVGSAS